MDGESLSEAYYSQMAKMYYDGLNTGYAPIEIPDEIKIARNEVPVLTWFINRDVNKISKAIEYWKSANDCVKDTVVTRGYLFDSKVYAQSPDSDAWQTDYCGPISKVAVLEKEVDILNPKVNQTIYAFLTEYSRYDNTPQPIGNQLGLRKPYGEDPHDACQRSTCVNTWSTCLSPQRSCGRTGAPVIFVFAGGSQTDIVFWYATQWWEVADKEGVILVFPREHYGKADSSEPR